MQTMQATETQPTERDQDTTVARQGHKGITEDQVALLHSQGLSSYQIAKALGCSRQNIDRRIQRLTYIPKLAENIRNRLADELTVKVGEGLQEIKWEGAKAHQIAGAIKDLHKMARLEQGLTTDNRVLGIVDITKFQQTAPQDVVDITPDNQASEVINMDNHEESTSYHNKE